MDRFAFLLKRPIQLIPVLLGISLITFVLIQLTPGDPVRIMLGPKASEDAIAFVRARYGLDQPILVQYFYFLLNAIRGDFGQSIIYRSPVGPVILDRMAPTLFLILYGLALSVAFTLGLAIAAARSRGRWVDQFVRLVCVSSVGIPSYFMGLMLILGLCLKLKLFPVSGYAPTLIDNLYHLFLPALTIAIGVTPILTRNLRATFLQQMDADYATAGRSKGLPERYIFGRHVFWNSLLPTVNLMGVVVSFLIGGTVVIENVFNIPGLGQALIRAVLTRDYFVVQAVTLVLACGIVITNFIVDVVTVVLDPRVKL
ncbi:peptide ABC transporter permease [Hypericibacter adhaerens]|jgi:peptide/nickel transport system permease protein|uniref:Peptide ABC transporter permease n=1 Tax=Hypericibacter adhaerens TaxID=2602016 RepID=A0A5J6MZK7_9PROT|nr:ABC transporter permease [Hypericibacter adhaerens]QEX20156.1 peptide ABC transporter permease [Hypericibacter adhaerens]